MRVPQTEVEPAEGKSRGLSQQGVGLRACLAREIILACKRPENHQMPKLKA